MFVDLPVEELDGRSGHEFGEVLRRRNLLVGGNLGRVGSEDIGENLNLVKIRKIYLKQCYCGKRWFVEIVNL